MLLHHVGYTVRDNPCLARTCACKNEERSVQMGDRSLLLLVKAFKDLVRVLLNRGLRTLSVYIFEISEKLV